MQLTKHFRLSEFACRDGSPAPKRYVCRVRKLAEQLEVLRAELGGRPIRVTSGYRTPSYNKQVGGARRSQHIQCRAADIVVRGVPARKVATTVRRLIREGLMAQGGVGEYGRFTHYDIRGTVARWRGR